LIIIAGANFSSSPQFDSLLASVPFLEWRCCADETSG